MGPCVLGRQKKPQMSLPVVGPGTNAMIWEIIFAEKNGEKVSD
jgi:hypothetical protein